MKHEVNRLGHHEFSVDGNLLCSMDYTDARDIITRRERDDDGVVELAFGALLVDSFLALEDTPLQLAFLDYALNVVRCKEVERF